MSDQKITKSTNIAELVSKYPSAARVLMEEGIGCLGCAIAHQEDIGQGLASHGKTTEEINQIIATMNKAVEDAAEN